MFTVYIPLGHHHLPADAVSHMPIPADMHPGSSDGISSTWSFLMHYYLELIKDGCS